MKKNEKQDAVEFYEGEAPVVTQAKTWAIKIRGTEGMLQNKMPDISMPKSEKKNQAAQDFIIMERENWRKKIHTDEDGNAVIPGECLVEMLKGGASYWGAKIPSRGNLTYGGIIGKSCVALDMPLGMKSDDDRIIPFGKNCNGNPTKKGGSMVYKIRPLFRPWGGTFILHVFDPRITGSVLRTILEFAGTYNGLGDWRPHFGRFDVVSIEEVARG